MTYPQPMSVEAPMPVDHYVGSTIALNCCSRPRLRHEQPHPYVLAQPPNITEGFDRRHYSR
jgi:hypothetical protein